MIPTIISHDSVRVRTAKSMDMMNCLLDPFNHFDATGQVTVLRVQVARRWRTEFQPINTEAKSNLLSQNSVTLQKLPKQNSG